MMYIYFIINKLTGKYYVGQTVKTVETRWKKHLDAVKYTRRNYYFHRAIKKYRPENFEIRTIFVCYDEKTLSMAEEYFIKYFDSNNPLLGYNSTTGGESGKHSLETLRKLSEGKKGKKTGRKASEKLIAINRLRKGIPRSPEVRRKVSETKKGKKLSEEHKKNMSLGMLGKKRGPISEQTRLRMREAAIKRGVSPESSAKSAKTRLGAKRGPYAKRGIKCL